MFEDRQKFQAEKKIEIFSENSKKKFLPQKTKRGHSGNTFVWHAENTKMLFFTRKMKWFYLGLKNIFLFSSETHHEERSITLFENLCKNNDISLTDSEIYFVQSLIEPDCDRPHVKAEINRRISMGHSFL